MRIALVLATLVLAVRAAGATDPAPAAPPPPAAAAPDAPVPSPRASVGCEPLLQIAFGPEYVRAYVVQPSGLVIQVELAGEKLMPDRLPVPDDCKADALGRPLAQYSFGSPMAACFDGDKLMIADVRLHSTTPARFGERYLAPATPASFALSIGSPRVATLTSRDTPQGLVPVVVVHGAAGGAPLLAIEASSDAFDALPRERREEALREMGVAISARGDRIAAWHPSLAGYGVRVWDAPDAAGVKLVRQLPIAGAVGAAFNPLANLLGVSSLAATGSSERQLAVADLGTGQLLHSSRLAEIPLPFALSPLGDRILLRPSDCGLALVDTASGQVLQHIK